MKIVYIAGPYSGANMFEVELNVRQSKRVALQLAQWKIPFFSPVIHTAHFETYLGQLDPGYQYWIDITLEMLKRCDALFMCPGWEQSRGATGEYNFARESKMPVFSEYDELLEWFHDQEDKA
jgi:Domain of unknown function (DUF4406)